MYIRVRVFPAQKSELVKEVGENRLEIRVREKAEQNLANKRVMEILTEKYGVSLGKIRLLNGHHHPIKLFSVEI